MRNMQDIVPLQVRFQREDSPEKEQPKERREERVPKQQLWRVELAFAIEPFGAAELYLRIAEIIAFAWNLKGKFPTGMDPDALMVEKDITERGEDY